MNGNYEKLKNVAAGIQSLVLSAAVVVGGAWSYYLFEVLSQRNRAQAELEDLRKISLDLSIDASQTGKVSVGRRGLIIHVKAKNNGARYINLDLTQKPLIVSRVLAKKDGQLYAAETFSPESYRVLANDWTDLTYWLGVPPGATKEVSYYVEITEPGIYMVSFRSPVPKELEEEFRRREGSTKDFAERAAGNLGARYTGSYWATTTFVEVR